MPQETAMTPQERQLVDDLFDRLAKLETSPRDPEADAAIMEGLRRAPSAVYALVQTALVQDEALRQAHARIQELEGGADEPPPQGGFLDSMRGAIMGAGTGRGSVPSVRAGERPVWNTGAVIGQTPGNVRTDADPRQASPAGNFGGGPFGGGNPAGGGSFLGTAAATAAGVIGGSMLMNSMRGMFGGSGGGSQQHGLGNLADSGASKSPWSNDASSGDLARDAGLNDVGRSDGLQRQASYDQAQADADQDQDQDDGDYDDYDDDGGGFDDGGGDYA
jgi:hypothetical protein